MFVTEPLFVGRSRLTRDILDMENIRWIDVRMNCATFVLAELESLRFQPSSIVRGCIEPSTSIVYIAAFVVESDCVTIP